MPQAGRGAGLQRDMQALRAAADEAAASFMVPPAVKAALPALVAVLDGLQQQVTRLGAELQELREQHRPPCEGCGGAQRDEAGLMMLATTAGMHG